MNYTVFLTTMKLIEAMLTQEMKINKCDVEEKIKSRIW